MYQIMARPELNLLEVDLGGLMSVAEVGEYMAALRSAFVASRLRAGYRLLIDVSRCPVQSQEMVGAMRAHMGGFPKAGRIAMVVGSSLAKMQVRRLMTQSYARIFTDALEARDWVLSPEQDTAAA